MGLLLLKFEDFPVGKVVECGPREVTLQEMLDFSRKFDPQTFHVDEEIARSSFFGGIIASGWHTCAMAMRMYVDGVIGIADSQGSPGVDSVRWLKPVRAGDVLRMRLEVMEARPSGSKPQLGLVRSFWQVLNQDGQVVMELSGWSMLRRRAAG
jgi:acyl dehydratase